MTKYNFPVYLINLEHDTLRKDNSVKQLDALYINPVIISACNGHQKKFPFHQYSHLSRGKWWDKTIFKPGAFACYLSHAKCWEKISTGSSPYAMVLEDDIIINQEAFKQFGMKDLPNSFDVIFINYGVTQFLNFTSFKPTELKNGFIPVKESLRDLIIHKHFNDVQPGSYAYLVSQKGAKKLLQIMTRHKVCMGVDYAMVFHSLDKKDIEDIQKLHNKPLYVQCYLNNLRDDSLAQNYKSIILDSYIYTHATVVEHDYSPKSSIDHEVYAEFNVFKYNFFNKIITAIKKLPTYFFKKEK